MKYDTNEFISLLEVLSIVNKNIKDYHVDKKTLLEFYLIKDRIMFVIHSMFTKTGKLNYINIPYLKRCNRCKKKADLLFSVDPLKSWSFHLNMLPICGNDINIPEKESIELLITFHNKTYSFVIPKEKTHKWNLLASELIERKWTPEKDYKEDVTSYCNENKQEELLIKLKRYLKYLENNFKENNKNEKLTKELKNNIKKIKESNNGGLIDSEFELAIKVSKIDTALSISKARYIVEKILKKSYELEFGLSPKRKMLKELMLKLDNTLTPKILFEIKYIQKMGNSCVHPSSNFAQPSLAEVIKIMTGIVIINQWFIDTYNQHA